MGNGPIGSSSARADDVLDGTGSVDATSAGVAEGAGAFFAAPPDEPVSANASPTPPPMTTSSPTMTQTVPPPPRRRPRAAGEAPYAPGGWLGLLPGRAGRPSALVARGDASAYAPRVAVGGP